MADRETKSATEQSQACGQECDLCGWPFGPALVQVEVMNRVRSVCEDPWACWQRQETMLERGLTTGWAPPTTST